MDTTKEQGEHKDDNGEVKMKEDINVSAMDQWWIEKTYLFFFLISPCLLRTRKNLEKIYLK